MFIRFNGQDYEVPSSIVIGSGILFHCDADDLGSFHAELRQRKDLIEIRGHEHPVSVNGVITTSGKWLRVSSSDRILLGSIPLEILSERSPNMKQVHSFHHPTTRKEYKRVFPAFLVSAAVGYWGMSDMPRADLYFTFGILGLMVVLCTFYSLIQTRTNYSQGYFSEYGLALYHRRKLVTESVYPSVEWQLFRSTFLLVLDNRHYQAKSPAKDKFRDILSNRAKPYVVKPVPYLAPVLMGLLILLFFV